MRDYFNLKIKKPKVIIFDIDDTLYSTKEPHALAMKAAFEFLYKITNINSSS